MKSRRRLLALVLLLLPAAASRPLLTQPTEPPRPALGDVEPEVARVIDEARDAVLAQPRSAAAWGAYGMTLDAHRLPEAAAAAYREAAGLDPDDFRWPYFVATLLELSDPQQGVVWHRRALEIDPTYVPGLVRLGETLEVLGRDREAREQFARAADLDPANPLARFGLGRLALANDRLDAALTDLERAYELAPHLQAIVATLARAYRLAGRMELARERAGEARRLPPKTHHPDPRRSAVTALAVDLESRLVRVQTLKQVGDLEQAKREIEDLLVARQEQPTVHFLAADIFDRLERPEAALAAIDRALELDPRLAGAGAIRAGALFKLQRFAEAERQAREVLALEPDNLHMLLLIGMLEGRRQELERMAAAIDHAFTVRTRDSPLSPLLARLLSDLAELSAASGDLAAAIQRAEQALEVASEAGAPPAALEPFRRRLDSYRQADQGSRR